MRPTITVTSAALSHVLREMLTGVLLVLSVASPSLTTRLAPPAARISVDGGYRDVLVNLQPDVCRHQPSQRTCARLAVSKLKELLHFSSQVLNVKLSGRAYFQSFSVLLPRSWKEYFPGHEEVAGLPSRQPDIVIESGQSRNPYVEHAEGCGHQGTRINLPSSFIGVNGHNTTRDQAEELVNKWIDFRFGVFDFGNKAEGGVSERQARLCPGKSYQEVIGEHPDSGLVKTDNEPLRAIKPEIKLISSPQVKYVVAIETSASMGIRDNWKWVNKAVQKLIRYDLPTNTPIAIVSFNNQSKVENHLEPLTDDARERIADTIPGKYQLAQTEGRDLARLLRTITEETLTENTGGVHLVIITTGGRTELNMRWLSILNLNTRAVSQSERSSHYFLDLSIDWLFRDESRLKQTVASRGLKVSTILLPTHRHLRLYDELPQQSGGLSFLIRKSPYPMDTYVSILESLMTIIQRDNSISSHDTAFIVHKKSHFTSSDNLTTAGVITLQPWQGRHTTFGVLVPDPEDHLIKSVRFEDEAGRVYGPYTKMSTSFDLINYKTPNMGGDQLSGHTWKYLVEWFATGGDPVKSVIVVTSEDNLDQDPVTLSCWVSTRQWSPHFKHLQMFAKVSQGNLPVQNLTVSLSVEIETENGTSLGMSPRLMMDDGSGDDDVLSGKCDGIYSLTITDYPAAGRYKFSITADDTDMKSYTTAGQPGPGTLVIHEDNIQMGESYLRLRRPGPFRRTVFGAVVHLSSIPSEDVVPPSKIGDLLINSSDNKSLSACWTSGGGDLSAGSVAKFSLLASPVSRDLLEDAGTVKVLKEVERLSTSGDRVCQHLPVPAYDVALHYGVVGVDKAGNRGAMSNIVTRTVYSPGELQTDSQVSRQGEDETETDWMMISIMSACLGGLFLLCITFITFLYITARRSRPVSPSPSSCNGVKEDQTDSSSCQSERSDTVTRHKELTDIGQILHTERVVPVYWSASQLLSKLETNRQPYHVSGQRYDPGEELSVEMEDTNTNTSHELDQTFDRDTDLHNNTLITRTRDSETDFIDSQQSLVDDFQNYNEVPRSYGHRGSDRGTDSAASSVSPANFRFERNGFYKSTRFRGGNLEDDRSYHDFCSVPEVENIPEKYFVTVSGFDDTQHLGVNCSPSGEFVTSQGPPGQPQTKPRNITEV